MIWICKWKLLYGAKEKRIGTGRSQVGFTWRQVLRSQVGEGSAFVGYSSILRQCGMFPWGVQLEAGRTQTSPGNPTAQVKCRTAFGYHLQKRETHMLEDWNKNSAIFYKMTSTELQVDKNYNSSIEIKIYALYTQYIQKAFHIHWSLFSYRALNNQYVRRIMLDNNLKNFILPLYMVVRQLTRCQFKFYIRFRK